MVREGVVLAGGRGTRLGLASQSSNKHLIAVYDKPMILYPVATLLALGVQRIVIVCNPEDKKALKKVLSNSLLGSAEFLFSEQASPDGLADALLAAESFITQKNFWMILGDNFFFFPSFSEELREREFSDGCVVTTLRSKNPERFGAIKFDEKGQPMEVGEKKSAEFSNIVMTGLYRFNSDSFEIIRAIEPSSRGELEITSLIEKHMQRKELTAIPLPEDTIWVDMGTQDDLLDAASFVQFYQKRTGLPLGIPRLHADE